MKHTKVKQAKVISVNAFARRFGYTRSAVIERLRRGTLASQFDTSTKLYSIPMIEVERTRNEIVAECRILETQKNNAQSIALWLDDQIAKAAAIVQEAEALLGQTVGTKAHSAAQETLSRAIAAHASAVSLRKPYLVIARKIESAGLEFIAQFKTSESDDEANAK